MKYSRNSINQAGKLLAATDNVDLLRVGEAKVMVDNWRRDHLPVLAEFVRQVEAVLVANDISVEFGSQRLKRMTSIIDKLHHNPGMCLGGVQDIAGARFVFSDMTSLLRAKKAITEAQLMGFELDRHVYDYISQPKESGYRSIHFVYKYSSADESLDGKRVELQIRTRLQHDWATAVETAELISNSALKAGIGSESWLRFFQVVSAIFATKEQQPVSAHFSTFTDKDYCQRFAEIEKSGNHVNQLRTLIGAVSYSTDTFNGGYVVLHVDYRAHEVRMKHYTDDKENEAMDLYGRMESMIDKTTGAALLVSVADMKDLLSAYPSYFMNANEFISALSDFESQCRVNGYLPAPRK